MAKSKGLSFIEKKRVVSKGLFREILGTLFYCFAAILVAIVLVVAFGRKVSVIGLSMEPTLSNSQDILVDRFTLKLLAPKRGDVVCFYPKGNENAHLYIKRVIGLPNEKIQIKDGFIYIDGIRYHEDDRFDMIEDPGDAEAVFTLGPEEYFVLGDNRNNSEDSRTGNIGAVKKDTIVGKVWFKLANENKKMGLVK